MKAKVIREVKVLQPSMTLVEVSRQGWKLGSGMLDVWWLWLWLRSFRCFGLCVRGDVQMHGGWKKGISNGGDWGWKDISNMSQMKWLGMGEGESPAYCDGPKSRDIHIPMPRLKCSTTTFTPHPLSPIPNPPTPYHTPSKCTADPPQAKKFVESVPQVLKENLPKEDAEKLQKTLEALGATVSLS